MNSCTPTPGTPDSDPALCPVCGGPNACQQCSTDAYKGSCWCESRAFPEELLARVPSHLGNRACVCRSCVDAAWRARPSPKTTAGDFYFDSATGLLVFTGQYLRRRGYCCDSGCRHCPWEPPAESDERPSFGVSGSLLLLALWLGTLGTAGADTVTERFDSDPMARGWQSDGASELFHWDAVSERLDVTWDSAKPQSVFAHSFGATLGANDMFSFGLDLVLSDALGGVRPPRTGAMQIAFGLLNLDRVTQAHYPRAAGRAFDVVEFNWFPQGEFPGFGVVDATVSPAVFSTTGRVASSFTFPLELAVGVTHQIRCEYQPSERQLVTRLISDGVEVAVRPVLLPEDFGNFTINAFALINWNEADGPYDSLLAHGHVDNVTWELPEPPIGSIQMTTPGVVTFDSRKGWRYQLEASGDLAQWSPIAAEAGTGQPMSLADLRDAVFRNQFYRVEAQPE